MTTQRRPEITIADDPDKQRFDIHVNGAPAGFSMYQDVSFSQEPQRIFYHTVIFDEFEGQGLASSLTRHALGTSNDAGRRIVAVCPYVKKWLTTHHDYDAALDDVRPEHLQALR